MLESIASAGAKFAASLATRLVQDWWKRRRIGQAYRDAAEAAIDYCETQRHPPGSPVWNELVSVLGNEDAAEQLAALYRRKQTDGRPAPLAAASPATIECVRWFISDLNERLRLLLPPELQIAIDILAQRGQLSRGPGIRQQVSVPSAGPSFPIFEVPHVPNRLLAGRTQLLTDIRSSLASERPEARVIVLYGVGGVGKTQLAVTYAHQHAAEYHVVWWVDANKPAALAAKYAALAVALNLPVHGVPDQAEVVAAVRRWLDQHDSWSLIFDGAERAEDVRDYIPSRRLGHVLITTLNPTGWERDATPLRVPPLDRGESVTFLLRRTGQEDEDAADELAWELGNLPLALEQACGYIGETSIMLRDYVNAFRSRRHALWEFERGPVDHERTVATTFSLAIRQVQSMPEEWERAGADVLNLCAFLAPDAIPLTLLDGAPESAPESLAPILRDPLALRRALATLWRYSLVEVTTEALFVHRLVQAVAQDMLSLDDQRKWAGAAAQVVERAFPSNGGDPRMWPISTQLLPHALATLEHIERTGTEPATAVELHVKVGAFLESRAESQRARIHFERALSILEQTTPPDRPKVADVLVQVSNVLADLGDLEEAQQRLGQARKLYEQIHNPKHQTVAHVLNNSGLVLRDSGELEAARDALAEALRIYGRLMEAGTSEPMYLDAARAFTNLGTVLRRLGQLDHARRAHEIALDIYSKDHNAPPLEVGQTLDNLALVLRDMGELEMARANSEQAVDTLEQSLGQDHPELALALFNLGAVLEARGDVAGAKRSWERAVAIYETAYGPDHSQTRTVRQHLQSLTP
jgi:tetratricopeptide (TPR) repeat protein